jgi:acyl-CoA thioester hydrolase
MAVEHSIQFRVRYDEADQMGVVHHSRHLAFFELGRLELLRAAGLPPLAQEERGRALGLRNIAVRYLAPARYDDLLELTTRVDQVRDGEIVFKSRLFRISAENGVGVPHFEAPTSVGAKVCDAEHAKEHTLAPAAPGLQSVAPRFAPPVRVAEATAVVAAITPDGTARPFSPEELAAFGGPTAPNGQPQ